MENNKKNFIHTALLSVSSHIAFSEFVNLAELLCDTDNGWFSDSDAKNHYQKVWFEMEIVNALALDAWETSGKPLDWSKEWGLRFKSDATELVQCLIETIQE